MTVPRIVAPELPDALPLAAAGAVIAGVAAVRWAGFLPMAVTLAILGVVALLLRWADAGTRSVDRPRIAIAVCATLFGGLGGALLLPRDWVGLSFALGVLVAITFGSPGRTPGRPR